MKWGHSGCCFSGVGALAPLFLECNVSRHYMQQEDLLHSKFHEPRKKYFFWKVEDNFNAPFKVSNGVYLFDIIAVVLACEFPYKNPGFELFDHFLIALLQFLLRKIVCNAFPHFFKGQYLARDFFPDIY